MATISGTHSEDGSPVAGYEVACYDYSDRDIANADAVEDTDTTDASGQYDLTTADTGTRIVIIRDPDDVKKMIVFEATPE
jgi:hypothetical protein